MSPAGPRLFFALWPDPELAAAMHQAATAHCADPSARLVPAGRLHMTLQFLGSQRVERLAGIRAAAASVHGRCFDLQLDRSGYWKRARVAWLAPGEAPGALLALVADLRQALAGIGIQAEARPFRPHITLSRNQREAPTGPAPAPLRWNVGNFQLVRSVTHPGGAEYSEVDRWPLAE